MPRWRISLARSSRTPPTWSGTKCFLDTPFEYPIQSDRARFSIHSELARLGRENGHRAALPAARRRHSGLRIHRRSRPGPARSALASGRVALREAGVHAHSGWHRSSAVSVLPGDPVPPLPRAHPDRDRVHRGAFDHADRLRLQPRARRVMVSAADRNADRVLDRIHGAREHRGRQLRCIAAG